MVGHMEEVCGVTVGDQEFFIPFGTYNIRNGRNGGLELELQGVDRANISLGVFQETKVTNGIHTRALAGYHVFATDAPSRHRGGVAVFYQEETPHFQVEVMQQHGPNVLSFQVDSGGRRWSILGCYLVPNNAATLEGIATAIGQRPRGAALLMEGDFNTDP